VGRIKTITTPRGFATTHDYDGRGRLIRLIEPETWQGQPITWRYDYDGVGNITNITDALDGHYVMTYGPRNERLLERNQDGKEWKYSYDALLRLNTQTDPNHVMRSLFYDPAGRLTNAVFSTGRVNSLAYDSNDNPTNLTRIDGAIQTALRLDYDNLDRLTNQTPGASLQAVGYTRDKLGRVAMLLYPGGKVLEQSYDALGRLTIQVFHFDALREFTNTYAYDAADRLIRRTYPNGVVQSNAFDSAGQITNLTHSPPNPQPSAFNIALSYAYDRNGNKIAGTEQGTLAWQAPPRIDERSAFSAAGRITNRVDALSTNTFTYLYDENGNMTNASGGGRSFALTYDEDNRVTSIGYQAGATNTTIVNRYDALGRRVRRTQDGEETRYALDLSGGMERILLEDRGGTLTYYVHGPDLCYRVNDDGSLTCFHADAMANVIALTDGNANTIAQYAYTPYGRVLGSTNPQPSTLNAQPFLFVGSQGVMEELPGLYFMRARYYSAEAGVFFSTDPVKNIGPGCRPTAYVYADGNPLSRVDPKGEFALALYYEFEQEVLGKVVNPMLQIAEARADVYAGFRTMEEYKKLRDDELGEAALKAMAPGSEFILPLMKEHPIKEYGKLGFDKVPFSQSAQTVYRVLNISISMGVGVWRDLNSGPSGPTTFVNQTTPAVLGNPGAGGINSDFTRSMGSLNMFSTLPSLGSGGASGGKSSPIINSTATAGSYGGAVSAQTQTRASYPSLFSGLTSSCGGAGNSQSGLGGNAFGQMAGSTAAVIRNNNPITSSINQAPQQAPTSIIQQIVSWFSGLFGGSSSTGGSGGRKP
jgi:RHS repeat-associated protein